MSSPETQCLQHLSQVDLFKICHICPSLGHLRNNLMLEETFLTVEKMEDLEWKVVARDTDWETKLLWTRTNVVTGESTVEVIWDLPDNTPAGTYRLGHRGYHKTLLRGVLPYEGWSATFQVGGGANYRSSSARLGKVWDPWSQVSNLFMKK